MIYDPRTNANDATKMCFAAQSCVGYNREDLLRTGIEDMVKTFDRIELSDQELTFYSRFMMQAVHTLHLIEYAKKTRPRPANTPLTHSELAIVLQDAELMLRTAEECTGTRRSHLVGQAQWELTRLREVYASI